MTTALIKKTFITLKRGSINRGRFTKYYEQKANYVRFWGMCDVTCLDYQIFIQADLFFAFLAAYQNKDYKQVRELIQPLSLDDQRFLLDGITGKGWREMEACIPILGTDEPLYYSGMALKSIPYKAQEKKVEKNVLDTDSN